MRLHYINRDLHSFPTRRSSDLGEAQRSAQGRLPARSRLTAECGRRRARRTSARSGPRGRRGPGDRKSTRLNSSHVAISYAVFCLKKKIYKQEKKYLKIA